jgi:hypothetical protein
MPTFIKMVVELEQASAFAGADFRAAVLFGWIGLMVALVAVITGEQGVWL